MPEKRTRQAAQKARKEGKSANTQAGVYVREEIEHIREGKHGARSTRQAIAIGLSKARRDGVAATPSKNASKAVKKKAAQEMKTGTAARKTSATRSKAAKKALKTSTSKAASKKAVSKQALATQARKAASKRTKADRSAAARKAAKTKGPAVRKSAAKKAARTRSAG